jgi:hypothetical protein
LNPKPTLLLSLVLALFLGGCRTLDGPALVPVPEETDRVSQWLSRERDAAAERRSVRAFGKLVLETARGTLRVKQVVIAQQPGQLRLESQNLLGQTQSLLVLDGGRFSFYDGSAIEHGAVTTSLLRESVGLDLAPADAVALLLARPPFPETEVPAVFAQGELRIAAFENARVSFSSGGELRGFERLEADGSLRWRADFAGWRDLANGRYPFAMQLEFPATELRARLEFQEAVLNPALLESLFRLEPRSHSTN